jgi:uncharacterized protein (DUF2062 family)
MDDLQTIVVSGLVFAFVFMGVGFYWVDKEWEKRNSELLEKATDRKTVE